MKKFIFLMIILILPLISSCENKKKTHILCKPISCIEDVNTSSLKTYLNIYTTTDITTLSIDNNKYIESAILVYCTKTLYQFDETIEEATIYQFLIQFKQEIFTLTNILVTTNINNTALDIGMYKTIKLNNDVDDILASTIIYHNTFSIYIYNKKDRTIYLTAIKDYSRSNSYLEIGKINPSEKVIYMDATRKINIIKVKENSLHTLSGILELTLTSNLKTYIVYVTYYINHSQEVIKIVPI